MIRVDVYANIWSKRKTQCWTYQSFAVPSPEEKPDQLPVMCDNHLLDTPQCPPFSRRLIWLLCPLTILACQKSKELFVRLHWKLCSCLTPAWPKMWQTILFNANYPINRFLLFFIFEFHVCVCVCVCPQCVSNYVPVCAMCHSSRVTCGAEAVRRWMLRHPLGTSMFCFFVKSLADSELTQLPQSPYDFPGSVHPKIKMLWAWVDRSFALAVRHSSHIPILFATNFHKGHNDSSVFSSLVIGVIIHICDPLWQSEDKVAGKNTRWLEKTSTEGRFINWLFSIVFTL